MKTVAEFIFLAYGMSWFLFVSVISQKHFNQGTQRLMRDMHEEYMNDTINGPRVGQPRAWERHERGERIAMMWGARILVAGAAVLYLILQFGK